MPRATTIVRKAAVKAEQVADTVSLDHAGRTARHAHLTTQGGLHIDLALERAAALEDGDALRLDDGRLVAVRAAEEALLEVRAGNPARLMRLAWQLGGNHVAAEVGADLLYVPASAAELVRGAGCTGTPVSRAFRPEKEAHDHSTCGHDHHHHEHHHEHRHDHGGHAHSHSHSHSSSHTRTHEHHDHEHRHEHRGHHHEH